MSRWGKKKVRHAEEGGVERRWARGVELEEF